MFLATASSTEIVSARCTRRGGAILAILVLGACVGSGATTYEPQPGDPLLEPWRLRTFPQMSGLGANCMAEGSDGALWFGTAETIWSFDGFDWVEHPIRHISAGNPRTFCPAPEGSIYAGGAWGIIMWRDGQWVRVFPEEQRGFAEIRKLIRSRDGSLWAATEFGALRHQGQRWTLFTDAATAAEKRAEAERLHVELQAFPAQISAKPLTSALKDRRVDLVDIAEDRDGRIWTGTSGGEILCFVTDAAAGEAASSLPHGTWTAYNETDGVARGRNPSLLPLRAGPVWVVYGTDSRRASVFTDGAWSTIDLEAAGVPGDCWHPLETRDGTIWLSSRYVVSAYRKGRWRTYQKPEVPIPSATNSLVETADGALWIGGPSTEILRVDYETGRWLTLQDLNFQWESPAGVQWFLHRSGRVVRHDHGTWTSFGVEDDLIDAPVALLGTRTGEVWAAGSHEHEAATARFDGERWTRHVHADFAWGVDWRGVFEASDGSLWFTAAVDTSGPRRHQAGILQYRDGRWVHHHQPGRANPPDGDTDPATLIPATQRPEPIGKFLSIGQSADGRIWAGRNIIVVWDGRAWTKFAMPPEVRLGIIETMLTTRERELWIGTRQFGALRYDGHTWHQLQHKEGLVANSVRGLAQTGDGAIWAATDREITRFDGTSWTAGFLPSSMVFAHESGNLKAGHARSLWTNLFAPDWMRRAWPRAPKLDAATCDFWTRCYDTQSKPPETTIITHLDRVSPPGNLSVLWSGQAPWRIGDEAALQFSHRLDDGPWSPFVAETAHAFFTLPPGPHRLEVRARDRDFNVDPTPAVLDFVVLPPVWQQGWFLVLMALLLGGVATQSGRVILERRRLRKVNRELAAEIEERRRAEVALRSSEASLKEAQSLAHLGSWTLELGSDRLQWSDEVYRILEFDPKNCTVSYEAFLGAVHPDDRATVDQTLRTSAREHTTCDFEHRLLFPDGRVKYINERCQTVYAPSGQPLRILGTAQDITLRRELEEQFRQSQKMEAVGHLAGGVAHDFNNILAAITMQVELAALAEHVPPEVMDELHEIRAAATRAANLTRQLLLFSRRQVMQPRELDLNDVVTHLGKMLQRVIGEQVRIEMRLNPRPLKVLADPGMLDQVLLNLAVNARDAMPEGGRLIVETSEETVTADAVPHVPEARPGRFACMSVRDTGCGIPPDVLPRIFEPFFTTKEAGKGTGLGLATVFGIVRQHRGWITLETAVSKGTCLHIHLPVSEAASQESAADTASARPAGGSETILFVEDDPHVRATTRSFLERHGYRILEAQSAATALSLWTPHRASIDLLLTDLILPDGVNGLKLARRLQGEEPRLKTILISGYAADSTGGHIEIPPDTTFLHKPFKPDDLLATLRRCLAR